MSPEVTEIGPIVVEMLLVAFGGGVLGAAIGGLAAFTLAGLLIVISEAAVAAGWEPTVLDVTLTGTLGLDPVLGPHVAFAGGLAAAAFAADRGYMPEDTEYHPAKAIDLSLGSKPDVLIVGGVFGAFGYMVARVVADIGIPMDPIAFGIVLSGFAHRAAFQYPIIGRPADSWLDMSAYDRGETRTDGERPAVEPFLPYQSAWRNNLVLGFGIGLFSGYLAYVTASPFIAFGLAIVTFIFVIIGTWQPPITLHMALPASIAALALLPEGAALTPEVVAAEISLLSALVVGGVFGAIAGLVGELGARLFYAHGDTHLDPPAVAITVTTLIIGLFVLVGVPGFSNPVVLPMP